MPPTARTERHTGTVGYDRAGQSTFCKQSLLVIDTISNAKKYIYISRKKIILKCELQGFPVSINKIILKSELRALLSLVVKNLAASAVDASWIPGPGRAHTSQGS